MSKSMQFSPRPLENGLDEYSSIDLKAWDHRNAYCGHRISNS